MAKNLDPLVSVLMPVFNAEEFLKEAIESILTQTYTNIEFLIFNDGSTDKSAEIITSFQDERIRFFNSENNKGYVTHLNRGLTFAKGKYIARMDADDISLPDRLEKQVRFLESNSDIGICGGRTEVIDEFGNHLSFSCHYLFDKELRILLFKDSCFSHPAVMLRREVLEINGCEYDIDLVPAEDYGLWYSISLKTKLANLPDVLLKYRKHNTQITKRKKSSQSAATDIIRKRIVEDFLERKLNVKEAKLHNSLLNNHYEVSKEYIIAAEKWLLYLIEHNRNGNYYDHKIFKRYLAEVWFSLCTHSYKLGNWIISRYVKSALRSNEISKVYMLKFFAKSFTRYSPVHIDKQ